MRTAYSRWRYRTHRLQEQWTSHRQEWSVEREIERVVSGSAPIVIGPWVSEVGYEALYWVPFVRWVKAAYRLKPERLLVLSRGGVDSWYGDITPNYLEIFDALTPAEFAARNLERSAAEGTSKQYGVSDLDRLLLERARAHAGADVQVLHPSLMYRLFKQFWSGHRPQGFLDSHTRYVRLQVPPLDEGAIALPRDYVAVKLYAARSLADTPEHRTMLRTMVGALAERWPVVLLDTGLNLDDHADYRFEDDGRIVSVRAQLDPVTNLGVQTQIIAGARAFVGTCGSVAWLAPMLGIDTTAVFTDARFLHSHLQVARRVYHVLDAGRFSPLDLSALEPVGLTLAARAVVSSGTPQP